jgi:Fusaric acid resistance protein-like
MIPDWYRDLYKIGSVVGAKAVTLRMTLAVGVPMIGGTLIGHPAAAVVGGATALFVTLSDIGHSPAARLGTMFAGWMVIALGGILGHELAYTPYSKEAVVLLCALLAGWASGSHPSIAAVTRYFAVAAAAGSGMRFTDTDVMASVVLGGVSAFTAALVVWKWFPIPAEDNVMDWRAGVWRACHGVDAGVRFTLCYGAAAAIALFAATALGVKESFWATLVVLMVMRREGTASLELTIHYAMGTIMGVVCSAVLLRLVDGPLVLAVLATLVAGFARVGFAVSPALGYMSFTMFMLFGLNVILASGGAMVPHLFETRLYDVTVGCLIALTATLAATYPRAGPPRSTSVLPGTST